MNDRKALLENESFFDKLFCDFFSGQKFSLYYNSNFSDDPIFNHAKVSDSILESDDYSSDEAAIILDSIVEKARSVNVPASIYIERYWRNSRNLEADAISHGFRVIEQMEILTKKPKLEVGSDSNIRVEQTKDVNAWVGAFAKSFRIPEYWIGELKKRTTQVLNDKSVVLLLATEENMDEGSGCLLFCEHPPHYLGVYCVGTIPERRSRGVAKSMLIYTESYARENGSDLVLLQTVRSDGVTPMYLKMGYALDFERDVLQMPA